MSLPMFQAIGTIVSVAGKLKESSANASAANYNAAVAGQNATIALDQGEAAVIQQRRTNDLRLGEMRAGFAASGLRSDTGSALDVLESSVAQTELDTQNIRYNALLKSRGFSQTAELDRMRASNATTTGLFSAAGQAILGGTKSYYYGASPKVGAGTPIPFANTGMGSFDNLSGDFG